MSTAFIVRLTWENLSQTWRIQFTPVNGDDPRFFCDPESLFCHIETRLLAAMEQITHNNSLGVVSRDMPQETCTGISNK